MTDPNIETPAAESAVVIGIEPAPTTPPRSQWADIWDQFRHHRGAMWGMAVFFLIPIYMALWDGDAKVNWLHPLGTDNLGRDTLARLLSGGRVSIAVGLAAMLLSVVLGTIIGVMAGYFRRLDGILMRLTDLFLALPLLPLLLVAVLLFREPLSNAFGPEGGTFILIVTLVGITSWMQTARIVRGEVLAIKEQEFILASRSIGTRSRRIILQHILPNVLSPVIVAASLGIAVAILTESAVSFLGLGFPLELPTWGRLLNDAKDRINLNIWLVAGPGLLLSATVMSVNLIGDGLRDALDPQTRSKG